MLKKRYIVIRPSDDGTFQIGDHIFPEENGSISCVEAQGWIDAENVIEARKGMECILDQEWIEKEKTKLHKLLESLDEL